jgi:hypothetical protein
MKTIVFLFGLAAIALGCASPRVEPVAEYPYLSPLSSPGQKFSGLPPAVQSTVRSQVGAAEMYDIVKNARVDPIVYEVHFRQPDLFPPMYIAADGSVLYPNSHAIAVAAPRPDIGAVSGGQVSGLKLSDLPPKVVTTIQEKAPTAEVSFINRLEVNNKVFYEITFKDLALNPRMWVAEDGVLLDRAP